MKEMKCINHRKVVKFMKEFADRAILDTGTNLMQTKFVCRGYFAALLDKYYPDKTATIYYGFENIQNIGQKQFRKDFTSRCKTAIGFADITLVILHEVGHFSAENVTYSYNRFKAVNDLHKNFPKSTINFEYFKLPDEKAATDWAITWLSIPENRKAAKEFEKKFFTCFEKRG